MQNKFNKHARIVHLVFFVLVTEVAKIFSLQCLDCIAGLLRTLPFKPWTRKRLAKMLVEFFLPQLSCSLAKKIAQEKRKITQSRYCGGSGADKPHCSSSGINNPQAGKPRGPQLGGQSYQRSCLTASGFRSCPWHWNLEAVHYNIFLFRLLQFSLLRLLKQYWPMMQSLASPDPIQLLKELQRVVRMQWRGFNFRTCEVLGVPLGIAMVASNIHQNNGLQARECIRALDDANLRAKVPTSYARVGDDDSSLIYLVVVWFLFSWKEISFKIF